MKRTNQLNRPESIGEITNTEKYDQYNHFSDEDVEWLISDTKYDIELFTTLVAKLELNDKISPANELCLAVTASAFLYKHSQLRHWEGLMEHRKATRSKE